MTCTAYDDECLKSMTASMVYVKKWHGGNLERLDEGPEQSANAFTATEQFNKPHDPKQTEEVDADDCRATRL